MCPAAVAGMGPAGKVSRCFPSASRPVQPAEEGRPVLIAGAGGGFDVYAGLPLVAALSAQGMMRQVSAHIEVFREDLTHRRPPRQYPH